MKRLATTLLLLVLWNRPVGGQNIFGNGFESGTSCGWSLQTSQTTNSCSLSEALLRVNSHNIDESIAGFMQILELTNNYLSPELLATPVEAAQALHHTVESTEDLDLNAENSLLTIAETHEILTLTDPFFDPYINADVSLSTLITELQAAVDEAYTEPNNPGNRRIVAMVNIDSDIQKPAPISPDTRLSISGLPLFLQWYNEIHSAAELPAAVRTATVSQSECARNIAVSRKAAHDQVKARFLTAFILRFFNAIINAGEAVVTCISAGAADIGGGILLDFVKDCTLSKFVEFLEIKTPGRCAGDVAAIEGNLANDILTCVAQAAPCAGDIVTVFLEVLNIVQNPAKVANALCEIERKYDPLHERCVACPCDRSITSGCFGEFFSCTDPVGNTPVVSCTCMLTVQIGGQGNVTSSPPGIDCGVYSQCTATFDGLSGVVLIPTPAAGWVFDGWSYSCNSDGAVIFNGETSCEAYFVEQECTGANTCLQCQVCPAEVLPPGYLDDTVCVTGLKEEPFDRSFHESVCDQIHPQCYAYAWNTDAACAQTGLVCVRTISCEELDIP